MLPLIGGQSGQSKRRREIKFIIFYTFFGVVCDEASNVHQKALIASVKEISRIEFHNSKEANETNLRNMFVFLYREPQKEMSQRF